MYGSRISEDRFAEKEGGSNKYKPSSADEDDKRHFCISSSDFLTRIKFERKN
jgi:hypothetical protein